ncbi:hypothetical protein SAMD00023353_6300690 [Rosellinia necatrix]|uniref:Uncharacterized protein n=1 Tax=Rosellinia necatrix TaxID=77044 RepID=A0A1W2TSD2_ROSNE|nr:hypothetical protein SAMD00023353_6300690 [Rosellinia necatrix]
MEGILLAPPERGPIIGRPVWKPRYVAIGPASQKEGHQSNTTLSQVLSTARIRESGGRSSKSLQKAPTDAIYFSVYKSRDEVEPMIQYSIVSITDCQVQRVAHRKQGHALPTLTIQIAPDPATDKLRKRRSSRTTGLISSRETGPTILCFVTAEESRYSVDEWARYIQSLMQRQQSTPMSPISPTSPAFVSPFPSFQDGTERGTAASSAKGKLRSKLQSKSSGRTLPSTRDQSSVYTSGSPSLRSRTSDISSHASSMVPAAMTFVQQHYANLQHSELPSPTSTLDEHPEQFVEGWTAAQGRTSALSSPIRGRTSMSSSQDHNQPSLESSPRLTPRETILDRAFQMRCIPGSDREIAGEEKLTSLARFEALMCEAENRKRNTRGKEVAHEPLKSTWEPDSDDDKYGRDVDDEDDDSDNYAFEHSAEQDDIDPSTFKALQFITNRHQSTYSEAGLPGGTPLVLRPHTAHSRSRPTAQRTNSQPYNSMPGPPPHAITSPHVLVRQSTDGAVATMRRSHEKRHSTSEAKNLSFNDFAKRLSGTSSLLLVQSNASTGSNRGSSDYDAHTPRGSMSPRGTSQAPDDRCRWRGSIGVFGNEGGFV